MRLIDDPVLREKIRVIVESARPLGYQIAQMSEDERKDWLEGLGHEEVVRLLNDWQLWARPNQREPEGDWLNWLILAGRGWGKTRVGSEWVHEKIDLGVYGRFHLVAPTHGDARNIMVEGPTGILGTAKPWNPVTWNVTKNKITWDSGAVALVFSAEEPDRFRGEQAEAAWAEEAAAWRYPESWDQLQLGLRLGVNPRTVITTTPRPTEFIKSLASAPTTHVTKGITYENIDNLAPAFIAEVIRTMEGTHFGMQEIYAEILDDAPGALFSRETIKAGRRTLEEKPAVFERIVVAVDPAISVTEESSETGIIVAGRDRHQHAWILQDASGRMKPDQWAQRVVGLYRSWQADAVVVEVNQGGDVIKHTIEVYDPSAKVVMVRATRGKMLRAEPVSTLYEKGLVHHVGYFDQLEQQMCGWEPTMPSPDRLDAMVWAITELLVGASGPVAALLNENSLGALSYWREVEEKNQKPAWIS